MASHTFPSRPRIAICIVAVAACVPYVLLKTAWIVGSDIGIVGTARAADMRNAEVVTANALTLGLELGAVATVVALTFARRIPPLLVLGPIWVGTGLLAPLVVELPLGLAAQAVAGGSPAPDGGVLAGWVFMVVYGGFILQAPLLIGAFALHVISRWPWVLRLHASEVTPGTTYGLQFLIARAGTVVAAVLAIVHVLWAIDAEAFAGPSGLEDVAHRTFALTGGALPLVGAIGAVGLVRRRRAGSLLAPLVATWIGSASAFVAVLPSNGQAGLESFVDAVSGMTGVALAITGLLVVVDARPRTHRR